MTPKDNYIAETSFIMNKTIQDTKYIPEELAGMRLDKALAVLFPDYSRAMLSKWLKSGDILINGQSMLQKEKVKGGEHVSIGTILEDQSEHLGEHISLDIIHEDDVMLIINKPSGLIVHPGAGMPSGTLLNGLLNYLPDLQAIPRAGIVHRLDKHTTGLMVVAKNLKAHHHLVSALQTRKVKREYEAIVVGDLVSGKTINKPISRHPKIRTKMAIAPLERGKEAITEIRVLKRFGSFTHIKASLQTGRTHQIRVHMASIKHPLVGDNTYGGRLMIPKGASEGLTNALRGFKRQALHARTLSFIHPESLELVSFSTELPDDMQRLLALL